MTLQNLDIIKELKNFGKLLNSKKADDFKFSWIRLARTKNVGSKTFVQLLKMGVLKSKRGFGKMRRR